MDIYKIAARKALRFATTKGNLTVEQLWTLKLSDIIAFIRSLSANMQTATSIDERLSFLDSDEPVETNDDTLRFEILKDIYMTKKAECDAAKTAEEKKIRNREIDMLIARKKQQAMENLSIEELEKLKEN